MYSVQYCIAYSDETLTVCYSNAPPTVYLQLAETFSQRTLKKLMKAVGLQSTKQVGCGCCFLGSRGGEVMLGMLWW